MTFIIAPLLYHAMPNFSEPDVGFAAQHSDLSGKVVAWQLLNKDQSRLFTDDPLEYFYHLKGLRKFEKAKKRKSKHHKKNRNKFENRTDRHHEIVLRHVINDDEDDNKVEYSISDHHFLNYSGNFFCDHPKGDYAKVIITAENEFNDLWSLEALISQCILDIQLRESKYFPSFCVTTLEHENQCCRSWSPANYIAAINNKTSCLDIKLEDITRFQDIVRSCLKHYLSGDLTENCEQDLRCRYTINEACHRNNYVYHLLEYIVDYEFLSNGTNNATLPTAMIMLPIATSTEVLEYYEDIIQKPMNFNDVHVSALDFGLKFTVFNELLIRDSIFLVFGMIFVTLCVYFYTKSIIITLGTFLAVTYSLGVSYFVYTYIFNIEFFPFMNLLTLVVIVGIGSDDTFIFCKFWEMEKRNASPGADLTELVMRTMKYAIPAMFVTTITTAGAFIASMVSQVTAIDCFSIFSGLTVLINFLFMITWLPACVIVAEKYEFRSFKRINNIVEYVNPITNRIFDGITNLLFKLVLSVKYLWFIFFLIIGVGSFLVVFWYPGLRLPETMEFQLFQSSHLFEQYELFYSKRFWFERKIIHEGQTLPLRFIWGVHPLDNTKHLDPHDIGILAVDNTFNMSHPESQVWLFNFCSELRNQTFFKITPGWLPKNCFIETLQKLMATRSCQDVVDNKVSYEPCCEKTELPYTPEVFKLCTAVFANEIQRTPAQNYAFKALSAGPKFLRQNDTEIAIIFDRHGSDAAMKKAVSDIRAVIIEFDSYIPYTISYAEMDRFYNEVESWMKRMLKTAPPGMKNGWFTSEIKFYALQQVLQEGTYWAIIVALFIALIVLGSVTSDMALSLCAMTSVGGAIITTVACTILMGWRLNVLESIAISTAIGLATDFSLHFSVGYRENSEVNRIGRARSTLVQYGGPTLMAALTTGTAGAFMLPSQVLAYTQIGTFLVIVMAVSWLFGTFFLCSTLAIMGPTKFRRYFSSRNPLVEQNDNANDIPLNEITNENFHEVPLEEMQNDCLHAVSADEVPNGRPDTGLPRKIGWVVEENNLPKVQTPNKKANAVDFLEKMSKQQSQI